ncbi:hypothetical protein FKM82_014185 [Ascaphus truei]
MYYVFYEKRHKELCPPDKIPVCSACLFPSSCRAKQKPESHFLSLKLELSKFFTNTRSFVPSFSCCYCGNPHLPPSHNVSS